MDVKERNEIFERLWPGLKPVIWRLWKNHATTRRLGTLEDVESEAAAIALQALNGFIPAPQYESPAHRDGHIKGYLRGAISRGLTWASRRSNLVHVPPDVAAAVFQGDREGDAQAAVNCGQIDESVEYAAELPAWSEEMPDMFDLQKGMDRLQVADREFLCRYWGIAYRRHTLAQLAELHGITRNAARRRVRAIEVQLRMIMTRA